MTKRIDAEIDLENIFQWPGRDGIDEERRVIEDLNTFLFLSSQLDQFPSAFFDRHREIGERKIVGLGRARQVFWWRRDAQRPSYSRLSRPQPPRFVLLRLRNPKPYRYTRYNNLTRWIWNRAWERDNCPV